MGLGPVEASRRALANAGLTIGDIDLVEINEAFAVQVIARPGTWGRPGPAERPRRRDRVGHPFGSTGARIVTTLINAMQRRDVSSAWRRCASAAARDGDHPGADSAQRDPGELAADLSGTWSDSLNPGTRPPVRRADPTTRQVNPGMTSDTARRRRLAQRSPSVGAMLR